MKLKVKYLRNFKDKSLGLMFRNKIIPVYFETRYGVHTFGMKENIDVYVLDRDSKIVDLRKNLKPNRVLFWNPKFFRVVETPIKLIKAKLGDKLKIEKTK